MVLLMCLYVRYNDPSFRFRWISVREGAGLKLMLFHMNRLVDLEQVHQAGLGAKAILIAP